MKPILTHAFTSGLVLSGVFGALLLGVFRMNAEVMLNDYPPDIRAAWGPMSPRTKRQKVIVAMILSVAALTIVAWSLKTMPSSGGQDLTFVSTFAHLPSCSARSTRWIAW